MTAAWLDRMGTRLEMASRPRRPSFLAAAGMSFGVLIIYCFYRISWHKAYQQQGFCDDRLKQIAYALQAYHSAFGKFPPPYKADSKGQPLHSWRLSVVTYTDFGNGTGG